jgi:multidrug efflux pump
VLGSANEETSLKESFVPMVSLNVVPQPGANYVQIAKDFYVRLSADPKGSAARY